MACMFTIANFQGVLVDSHQLGDILSAAEAEEPLLATPPFLPAVDEGLSARDRVCEAVQRSDRGGETCYMLLLLKTDKTKNRSPTRTPVVQRTRYLKIAVDRMLPHEKLSSRDVIGRCASARPNFAGSQLRRSFSLDPVVRQREGLCHFESIGQKKRRGSF